MRLSYHRRSEKQDKISTVILKYLLFSILIPLLVYIFSINNPFVYDDYAVIEENSFIKDFKNLPLIFTSKYFELASERSYRPIVTITYFLDYYFSKLNPIGYHLTSIIFHLINIFLIFKISLKLFGHQNLEGGFLASLLFGVHPALSEAILSPSFREDLIVTTFFLLSFNYYINNNNSYKGYLLSIFFFFISLFAKEMSLVLPLNLTLYEIIFSNNKKLLKILPYYLISVIYTIFRLTLLVNPDTNLVYPGGSLYTALLTFSDVILKYITLLFFPFKLRLTYDIEPITDFFSFSTLFSFIALFFLLILLPIKFKIPILTFSIYSFIINLIPVSNIIPIGQIMAERYLYLPSWNFFIIVGAIYNYLILKYKRKVVVTITLILLLSYSFLTLNRIFIWKDPFYLWLDTIVKSPNSGHAYNNLGIEYFEEGNIDKAEELFKKAILFDPYDKKKFFNLGRIYLEKKDYINAKIAFQKTLLIDPSYIKGALALGIISGIIGEEESDKEFIKKISKEALNYYYQGMKMNIK